MKTKTLVSVALFAAGVMLLGSCTPDGGTIYSIVETETKTPDNSLPNNITIGDFVSPAANSFYVAAGHLYEGVLDVPTNKVTWTSLTTTPAGSLATVLAARLGTTWAGFITGGGILGLYSSADPVNTAFGQEPDAVVKNKQIYGLSVANGVLFAVCAVLSGSSYVYELESYNGAWSGPLGAARPDPIVGVAWDGTSYLMASGDTIYSDLSATGTFAAVAKALSSGSKATSIFSAGTTVFVTTRTGGIYYGAGWTQVAAPVLNSAAVPLLSIAGPINGSDLYLVGSDGFGYFVFSTSAAPASAFGRFTGSTIGLWSASVRRILLDGTTVLMGTNNAGLWRATLDASGNLVPPTGPSVASTDTTKTTQTAAAWSQE